MKKIRSPSLFYAFVDFGSVIDPHLSPTLFRVRWSPETVRLMHAAWLAKPGQKGKSTTTQIFADLCLTTQETVAKGHDHIPKAG